MYHKISKELEILQISSIHRYIPCNMLAVYLEINNACLKIKKKC